jgi:hypothetical protein
VAAWDEARAAFERALAVEDSAQALDGCGLAHWFLGDLAEGVHSVSAVTVAQKPGV